MAYSRYELPVSAFEHFPGLFRSIGMTVVEVPMEVRQSTLFDSDDHVRNPRKVYVTNVRGHDVKIFVRQSSFEGKTTAFARLAADGSILRPDIAQTLDLAFARIGARISTVERPLSLRVMKSGMKELFDVRILGKPRANLPPEPDAETVEAAIRNRNEIWNRSVRHQLMFLSIILLGALLAALISEFESLRFLLFPYVALAFPTMTYLFIRDFIDKNRYFSWLCPRCGKRFMPYASNWFNETRCRYCGWEIPPHLR
jgi:hypothetical protein